MTLFSTKRIFFFILCGLLVRVAGAQSLTIGVVDPGPYGQGSTIGVPFTLNTSKACASSSNVFNLYLSDAAGNFSSQKLIGNYAGFYGTFVNGIIPAGTPDGSNYKVKIQSTDPAVLPVVSSAFTVNGVGGVVAALSGQIVDINSPEVFGSCIGAGNTSFPFTNVSSPDATATATFYNELDKTYEGGTVSISGNFIAKAANYTIILRAINNGVIGTKAYTLINNVVNNSLGTSGSNQVCLNGKNKFTYNVNVTDPARGLQLNYPGLIYAVTWGDGTSTNYTLCDIVNAGGLIDHTYRKPSCGNVANGQANVFQVDFQPINPYCGKVGTPFTGYAQIVTPPKNIIQAGPTGCTNTPVTFYNISISGQDPNSKTSDCTNVNALYSWAVDGTVVLPNARISDPFTYTFTTNGQHFVGLHLQNPNAICDVKDTVVAICIQNPPKPAFDLPNATICNAGIVSPVNTSVIDAGCNITNSYKWYVAGPGSVIYSNNTNASSKDPTFNFSIAGKYAIRLGITTQTCGEILSATDTIVVNLPPTASLAANLTLCGNNQILSFSPTAVATKTLLTGTQKTVADTYTWTVTGGAFTFANNTNNHSQYPQIQFNDFGTYTVNILHQNNCNPAGTTATQQITFQNAPTVSGGGDQIICEGNSAILPGIVGNSKSYRWTGGTGTFIPDRNALQPQYIPSAAEISAGTATVTLEATTTLAAPCNIIYSPVVLAIKRKDNITSAQTGAVCTGQNFHYDITSGNPLSTFTWVANVTSGSASGYTAKTGTSIDDVLINTGQGDAVVTYTITPATNGCPGSPFQLKVSVDRVPVLTAVAVNASVCTGKQVTIALNSDSQNTTYTWTSTASLGVSGNTTQTSAIAANQIQDVLLNGGITGGTVTYTITPYHGACAGTPVDVTITVVGLPIQATAGGDQSVCESTTVQLKGNDPSPGKGRWSLASAQTGVSFSNNANPNAIASGLKQGNVYKFVWAISASPDCDPTVDTVAITVNAPTVAGNLSGATSVCKGSNAGNLTLAGNVGAVTSWEYSTDGLNWINLANVSTQQAYLNLTQTTQYRAVVQNGTCTVERSASATVTVNQPAISANAGVDITLCNAASATMQGNNPAPFVGIWSQTAGPAATISNPSNPLTEVTGLSGNNNYKFVWTIKGIPPCGDSGDTVNVINAQDVLANFSSDNTNGCGPTAVKFTNTSSLITGTSFVWDFGDGTANSNEVSPQHTFLPQSNGRDTIYKVSLSLTNNCVPRAPITLGILVRPAIPVAKILPDRLSGCGSFAISAKNVSPGTNVKYDFYLYNSVSGALLQKITKTDKTDVTFNPVSPTVSTSYNLTMIATGYCGTTAEIPRPITITVSPASFVAQAFAKDAQQKGCAPFTTAFINNSSGGDTFKYRITDVNNKLVDDIQGSAVEQPYTFTNPGIFYVRITAINDCGAVTSKDSIKFEVSPIPLPNFDADIKSGCKSVAVKFSNSTVSNGSTPAESLAYDWDFGDGSDHYRGFTPIAHVFTAKNSPFTITLKVTNLATGCQNVISKPDFINVNSAPSVSFAVSPDTVTTIPNYHFAFDDNTSGNPVNWQWTFGDGSTSNSQNPAHTYADTGVYSVTLKVINRNGCDSTLTRRVHITGTPGQLYLPNAFMPAAGASEIKEFAAKGSGIATWHLQIFNGWGQLVFETTKLNSTGEPVEAWNGTYKGVAVQQGVYIWQASAKFINGTEWKGMQYNGSLPKHTGVINLIR